MTMPSGKFWHGKRVLLTGHTGFKGSWLGSWLTRMGAETHGISLAPETTPNLHDILSVPYASQAMTDLRDAIQVAREVSRIQPQIVLHLAAQALVRRSYEDPVESIATNVLGTAHLLDALRHCTELQAVLVVTSDKAYDNPAYIPGQNHRPFTEADALGGRDPYSASKGSQEIVTRSFAQSFFKPQNIPVVTARAGNVIGGGDWSQDRLMTDIVAAASSGQPVTLRSPDATRPWQHVMDPLAGYLLYVENLVAGATDITAMNFGPDDAHSVSTVTDLLSGHWPGAAGWTQDEAAGNAQAKPEAAVLALDSSLARQTLGWHPKLEIEAAVKWVADWHRAHLAGDDMAAWTRDQIRQYQDL